MGDLKTLVVLSLEGIFNAKNANWANFANVLTFTFFAWFRAFRVSIHRFNWVHNPIYIARRG